MGNILLVEDDRDVRAGLQEFLHSEGYAVDIATNGREGLQKMAKSRPSLVLLDLMMPVMNGWEFLEEKNQFQDFAGIPVLVISAVAGKPYIPGALAFLKKPIDLERLMDFVQLYCA